MDTTEYGRGAWMLQIHASYLPAAAAAAAAAAAVEPSVETASDDSRSARNAILQHASTSKRGRK